VTLVAARCLIKGAYLRLRLMPIGDESRCDHDGAMQYLDRWAALHARPGYVPGTFRPMLGVHLVSGVQQVRAEISEFVRVLLSRGLGDTILEIGLGEYGGTHMLWRRLFNNVVTVERDGSVAKRFRRFEWLDSRSRVVVGKSTDVSTLRLVQNYTTAVDVLFIDGDHSYEGVASDWDMYHHLAKPGGIIAFHDSACCFGGFGVGKFLKDLSEGHVDGKMHVFQNIRFSDAVGISYEVLPETE